MTALLEAALGYAARGIPTYPMHWPRHTPGGASLACSCHRGPVCDRPAKHPLVRHGVKEATTDPDRIGRWWHRWPQANLGGPVAGTTGSPRPGRATAHPAASPTSIGAAAAAACSSHPAATSPVAATAGWLASTRHHCPRSQPPSASCSTPTGQPLPDWRILHGRSPRTGRPHSATRTAAGSWPTSWPPLAGHPRPAQPHPQPDRVQGLPLRRRRHARRGGRHPCVYHRRARHRPQPGRNQPHPRLGPHRRPGQPPHHPSPT